MLACILLTTASLLGAAFAIRLPLSISALSRLALGVLFGQLILLWLPFSAAACFDLSVYRAGLLTLVLCASGLLITWRPLWRGGRALLSQLLAAEARLQLWAATLLALLLGALSWTHYLAPRPDGLHASGVTWGDLPVHLALATRALYAPGLFTIEHPLFLGGPLAYPFLPDYSVAVLCALGLPLRAAFVVGGLVPLATLAPLLFELTQLWLPDRPHTRAIAALSVGLFFLAGGLGFGFVLEAIAAGESLAAVLARMNATYIDPLVLKSGSIGNLFLAARSAAYGMPLGAAALLLLGQAAEGLVLWLVGGALIGLLPLVHGHSYLALSIALVFYSWPHLRRGQLQPLSAFALLALLSAPQLLWLAAQGAPKALRFLPGMLQPPDGISGWLRDVALDLGVWLVLVPLAYIAAPPRARRLALPLLLLAPLSNIVCFTPAQYDNVKLLAWFDLGAAPLVAALLARLLERGGTRRALGCLAAVSCTLSGLLALLHELTNDALVVSTGDLALAELVRDNTPPDAVVATAASYHDPVAMFSGRRVPLAAPAMLATHGIFVGPRAHDVIAFFRGGPEALGVQQRLGITAAVVSARERQELPWLDEAFLRARASRILEQPSGRLYLLRTATDGSALVGLLHDGAREHQDQK